MSKWLETAACTGTIDAMTSFLTLEHMKDARSAMNLAEEISKVLSCVPEGEGGIVVLVDENVRIQRSKYTPADEIYFLNLFSLRIKPLPRWWGDLTWIGPTETPTVTLRERAVVEFMKRLRKWRRRNDRVEADKGVFQS